MDAAFSLPTEIPQRGCQKKWYGRCRVATRVLLFTTLISLSNLSQAGVPDEVEGACAGGDDAKTLEVLRAEAEHGDAEAQNSLGLKYYYGQGVPQSFRESVAWYRRSAAQGNADAQHNLGLAYEDGTGVRRDYRESARWYRLAADQGNPSALTNLAWYYWDGHGVRSDDVEAVRLTRLAAQQGFAIAQSNLGLAYAHGRGVKKDDVEAVRWYRLAAAQGYPLGQVNLGLAYSTGAGVELDLVESWIWLERAADEQGGMPDARQYQAKIERLMTHQQIEEARRRFSAQPAPRNKFRQCVRPGSL